MFILWIIAYILIGILVGTGFLWFAMKCDEMLTLKDLFIAIVCIGIWPLILAMFLFAAISDSDNIVIWKKKK